jgi:hypothetical protein
VFDIAPTNRGEPYRVMCVLVLVLYVGTYSLVADCLNVSTEQQLPVGSYFSFPLCTQGVAQYVLRATAALTRGDEEFASNLRKENRRKNRNVTCVQCLETTCHIGDIIQGDLG